MSRTHRSMDPYHGASRCKKKFGSFRRFGVMTYKSDAVFQEYGCGGLWNSANNNADTDEHCELESKSTYKVLDSFLRDPMRFAESLVARERISARGSRGIGEEIAFN